MIGPGTGIALFRSFLFERDAQNASGKNWLFFGGSSILFPISYIKPNYNHYLKHEHLQASTTQLFRATKKKKFMCSTECCSKLMNFLNG